MSSNVMTKKYLGLFERLQLGVLQQLPQEFTEIF